MNYNKEIIEEKAKVLKAISHPVRLCIVRGLLDEEGKNVTTMQNCLDAPQSTISQHLSKLKAAGIVKGERQGVEVKYYVINEDIRKIIQQLF
ncbi:MAG: helix-turn-helix transcriptional regulator [Firmicutes bacterium]|nr:helix-turn-helix transcriptional regulator [Bacillota bacterium]